MSIWSCPDHGITGPTLCCSKASRVEIRLDDTGGVQQSITYSQCSNCAALQSRLTDLQAKYERAQKALRQVKADEEDQGLTVETFFMICAMLDPPQETNR